ncbi:MAG: AmmeMemoRadiSam system protein B [Candidatus Fischerbacteria bacterium RBG_13_37_8]|uniref:AmmeMemoRadiSam system protein B n=1 Tax=Candidatus Fischerbacteria bacterium RBG_13_37_8 TaxID=1817863 RepID=A0A1F5VW82_9BACT|nr:MAG: AmmeMemoRadiSam system protein B [Candidatus Fischerbacteria bacterium RBG_13_37_8]
MKCLLTLLITLLAMSLHANDIRPVRDDIGYCWTMDCMKKFITYLESHDQTKEIPLPIIAGITPHDDFLYAGTIYYPLYKNIKAKEAVIFGVTHKTVRDAINDPQNILILDEFTAWKGLNGTITVSPLREYIKSHLNKSDFMVSNKAHELEHSIEGQLPFLHYFNQNIRITPIMVTGMPFEKMEEISTRLAEVITAYIHENNLKPGKDIVFLFSADANHYGKDFNNTPFGEDEKAHEKGINQDLNWVKSYLTGKVDNEKIRILTTKLWGATYRDYGSTYWCGKYSIPFGMLTTMKIMHSLNIPLQGTLLQFGDTYSGGVLPVTKCGIGTTAPFSLKHWVSFFSVAYH